MLFLHLRVEIKQRQQQQDINSKQEAKTLSEIRRGGSAA